jgi:hypothetical protein
MFLFFILLLIWCFRVQGQSKKMVVMDMVHNNPGEPLTVSAFNNSGYLKGNGYTAKVMNDFVFPHAAIRFKKLSPDIFPDGSAGAVWVDAAAERVRANIREAHAAGIQIYYFTDIIVLPKKLVEMYRKDICDSNGKISFERPKTIEIHRLMLEELFETFPDLDGLVIRTGETYTDNVPFHTGNNPITNGEASHIKLINLLREEVCVKLNKKIFYRTWSFGGMHDDAAYYLNVTNSIAPHANLVFSIKHTKGDYQRTYDFNPTLGLGKHPQIVEVQCQREYEGKGAYPNYVMDGVINGFEEYFSNKPQKGNKSLNDIKDKSVFAGIWTWSRGGGWVGPYITNELWPRLNAFVLSHWAADTRQTEAAVFDRFMAENGVAEASRPAFRQLALLSAKAVIRGHASVKMPFDSNMVFWMRDEFLSGIEPEAEVSARAPSEGFLFDYFEKVYRLGLLDSAVMEKQEAVSLWQKIAALSAQVHMNNKQDETYLQVSATYGLLLHRIIAEGWKIMALGFVGDKTGVYDYQQMGAALIRYDAYWREYEQLPVKYPSCASLYKPVAFVYKGPAYHLEKGMSYSVEKYRKRMQAFKSSTGSRSTTLYHH